MRCSHPERACTFVFTTLLFILSFTTAQVESATVHGFQARHAWRKRASIDMIPTGQEITSTPSGLLPTTIPPLSLPSTIPTSPPSISIPILSPPTPLPPLSIPSLQTSNPTTTSSSSDYSTPSPTSVPSASTTSTTTSQAQGQTTSNGTPLSISSSSSSSVSTSSSYMSSSQHTSSTTPSTSAAATAGVATPIAQVSVTAGYSGPVISTSYSTGTIVSSTPSSTSSSNSGFFSNTGAVAGTFTITGLVGVAGIIGVGMMIARRRASRPYEDDREYLEEKNREPPVELSQSQNFVVGDVEELSDLSHVSQSMEVTVPPAAHLYPQHDVYLAHGHTANESDGFENQDYYPQVAYAPQEYGIAYPPGESFTAEDAYGGLDEARSGMPNPFDNVATEPPAASNQYLRTASPPLTAYLHRSIDSFYGSSAAASHGHAM